MNHSFSDAELLYRQLTTEHISDYGNDIKVDKFNSNFDCKHITFANDELSETEEHKKCDEYHEREKRVSSKFPSLSRFNSLLSIRSLNSETEELYDLAEEYGVSVETIQKCGTLSIQQFLNFRAVFDYIDSDKSGSISIDEFCEIFNRIDDIKEQFGTHDIQGFLQKVDVNND
eukprot:115462_1